MKQVTFQDITPGEPAWSPRHRTSGRHLSSQICLSKLPQNQPTTHEKRDGGTKRAQAFAGAGTDWVTAVRFSSREMRNPALSTVRAALVPAAHISRRQPERRGPCPGGHGFSSSRLQPQSRRGPQLLPGTHWAPSTTLSLVRAVL